MLYHEFGIDPAAVNNWDRFRLLVDSSCGLTTGRLLSRFPRRWQKLVLEACNDCKEIEKKRIVERLIKVKEKMFPGSGRTYDSELTWIANALREHENVPFYCIVTTELSGTHDSCLIADDIHAEQKPWEVEQVVIIERTLTKYVETAQVLLELSREVVFIDPHYAPEAKRFKTIDAFFRAALHGKALTSFTVNLKYKEEISFSFFRDRIMDKIRRWDIPSDLPVRFIRWIEKEGKPDLHPRYLLTELGGISYDHGLDFGTGYKAGTNCDVSLLPKSLLEQRRRDYLPDSTPFGFGDGIELRNGCIHLLKHSDGGVILSKGEPL